MELGGNGNATTSTTKTLQVKAHSDPENQAAEYRECQKNHAALTGGHVVDGCCKFMAGGEDVLKCDACGCHRSFHRKEVYGQLMMTPAFYCSMHHPTSSSEDMKKILRKRVRTKINEAQKEKMKEFAERLGWRMQKKDEQEIDKFCRTLNLRRQVFKVWMHNNKQARNTH